MIQLHNINAVSLHNAFLNLLLPHWSGRHCNLPIVSGGECTYAATAVCTYKVYLSIHMQFVRTYVTLHLEKNVRTTQSYYTAAWKLSW